MMVLGLNGLLKINFLNKRQKIPLICPNSILYVQPTSENLIYCPK